MAEPAPPAQLEAAEGHAAAEGADVPPDAGRPQSKGIMGILMHSDPPVQVSQTKRDLDLSDGPAHFVVAGKKALDAVTDTATGSGTTVLEHVVAGTVAVVSNVSGDTSEPDTSEQPPETEIEPAGVVE